MAGQRPSKGPEDAVKEMLSRARGVERCAGAQLAELEQLRGLRRRLGELDSEAERFGTVCARLGALEEELEAELRDLLEAKQAVRRVIQRVEAPEERTLLQLRYLCGRKWDDIADAMGYSWQGIHKVHRRVLGRLQEWMEVDADTAV